MGVVRDQVAGMTKGGPSAGSALFASCARQGAWRVSAIDSAMVAES